MDQAYITQSKINLTLKYLKKSIDEKFFLCVLLIEENIIGKDCCATPLYLHIPCIFHHSRCFDIQKKLDMHPLMILVPNFVFFIFCRHIKQKMHTIYFF